MSTPAKPAHKAVHPLPLSSTLHDLALLRASDLDFAALLPLSTSTREGNDDPAVEQSVQRSLEFSREARAALKLLHTDAVDKQGARVDGVREKLEDVVQGLEGRN
ncbi:hypothetical protein TRAPUB_12819 [Trametes pubescens]|uniref:Uncharacterized protein n=1 Tax=Trametes pubescens TaxID=154538 RepID=A0A1M2VSU4_TRAPU|nr:hypothetical protein TRAPUB_12819 [Trametes pubescens]